MYARKTATKFIALLLPIAVLALFTASAMAESRVQEEFHQKYPFTSNGRVEVDNTNGKIEIIAADIADVRVDAVKRADTTDHLKDCNIVVNAQPGSIRIETKYSSTPFNFHGSRASVDYTVTVPRNAQLASVHAVNGTVSIQGAAGPVHASSTNGGVRATALRGPADLSSTNGTVEATVEKSGGDIRMHSTNGSVNLTLPSDTQARIEAKTTNGGIHNDFGLTVNRRWAHASMEGELGNGTSRIELSTTNGAIRLQRAGDGKPLSKATSRSEHHGDPI